MCLYPRLIKNRKYVANKKNGGVVPAVLDERVLWVPVGCGKCMECMKQKAREWSVRLQEEIRTNKSGKMVTLSFSEEALIELGRGIKIDGYARDNEMATIGVRRFLERWRKKYGVSVRHWLITELGQKNTERIHLHGLLFTSVGKEEIEKIWKYGNVYIGDYVSEKTVNYMVKYVNKVDVLHKEYKPKMLTSQGMGKNYIDRYDAKGNKYKGNKTKEGYQTREGVKLALPTYYRNKIYSDEEREKLWLQKLDEGMRYVNGKRVSVKDGDEGYYRLLEEERKKNSRLGYGDDSVNWELKRYENDKRNIKFKERLRKKK